MGSVSVRPLSRVGSDAAKGTAEAGAGPQPGIVTIIATIGNIAHRRTGVRRMFDSLIAALMG